MIFFFNDTATTEIYTLSLHDALPICLLGVVVQTGHRQRVEDRERVGHQRGHQRVAGVGVVPGAHRLAGLLDRKSTRLNSSHANISYAVFCLKKKTYTGFTTHVNSPPI